MQISAAGTPTKAAVTHALQSGKVPTIVWDSGMWERAHEVECRRSCRGNCPAQTPVTFPDRLMREQVLGHFRTSGWHICPLTRLGQCTWRIGDKRDFHKNLHIWKTCLDSEISELLSIGADDKIICQIKGTLTDSMVYNQISKLNSILASLPHPLPKRHFQV